MPSKLRKRAESHDDKFSCAACSQPDAADDMVACDKCGQWYHYSCANVDPSITEKEFFCRSCKITPPPRVENNTTACVKCKQACIESEVTKCKKCSCTFHIICAAASTNGEVSNEWSCARCLKNTTKDHDGDKISDIISTSSMP